MFRIIYFAGFYQVQVQQGPAGDWLLLSQAETYDDACKWLSAFSGRPVLCSTVTTGESVPSRVESSRAGPIDIPKTPTVERGKS